MNRLLLPLLLPALLATAAPEEAPREVDLATVLRLAEAGDPEIALARWKLAEAAAESRAAGQLAYPWISPGISLRRHDGESQEVRGALVDTHKYSYAPGVTVGANLDLGEIRYRQLAARQRERGAGQQVEAIRRQARLDAALGYVTLLEADALVRIAEQGVAEAAAYEGQVGEAARAGVAFAGDALRASAQTARTRVAHSQALELRMRASARLAETLRLDPTDGELTPRLAEFVPLRLVEAGTPLTALVARVSARPDLAVAAAASEAARTEAEAAGRAQNRPNLSVQAFLGGLGGGNDDEGHDLGFQQDYLVGLGWKFGPGGIGDRPRREAAAARARAADVRSDQGRIRALLELAEAHAAWTRATERIALTGRLVETAEQAHRLTLERRQFGVGAVMEAIQSAQDLLRARAEQARAVGDSNRSQFALRHAAALDEPPAP